MTSHMRGFHLLELLVSLAVIAVLVQLATPHYAGVQEKTREIKRLSKTLDVQLSLETCYNKTRNYARCRQELPSELQPFVNATEGSYSLNVAERRDP